MPATIGLVESLSEDGMHLLFAQTMALTMNREHWATCK